MIDAAPKQIEEQFDGFQNNLVLQSSDFSLEGLRQMVEQDVIDLSPEYQRRQRWDPVRQSELIESFLLNVPVPPVYFSEDDYGMYTVIDGKQRVTAATSFLSDEFKLRGLAVFESINGYRFSQLPRKLQNALRVRPYLRVITLLRQSDAELKYEVFLRLNRGEVSLNNQEIRNVAFRGKLNDMIYSCENNKIFLSMLKMDKKTSISFQRMEAAEFALRFFTLRQSWKHFSGDLSRSMDSFMIRYRNIDPEELAKLKQIFDETVERVNVLWNGVAFQRWEAGRWRNQVLGGLFDAQMLAAENLSESQFGKISEDTEQVIEKTKKLFSEDRFSEAVRIGTNTPGRLRYRVERLLEVLSGD